MTIHPLRASSALPTGLLAAVMAAVAAAFSPSVVSAQPLFEYRVSLPGLAVGQASSAQETPASQPGFQLSTSAINFGEVATNTTDTRQVLVSNPGTGALSFITAPAATGSPAFAAGTTTCGATLAPGADCLAEVTFSPTSVGTYNGVLTLTSALAASPHEVTLRGTAFNPVSFSSTPPLEGSVGQAYSYDFKQLLSVSNETSPDKSLATWSLSGTLAAGLTFNSTTGVLSGTPSAVSPLAALSVSAAYRGNTAQADFFLAILGPVDERCANGEQTCAVFTSAEANPYVKVENPLVLSTTGGSAPTSSAYASARASRSVTTGKHYWEMTRIGPNATYWHAYVCGIAPLSFSLAKLAGYEGGYAFAHASAPTGSVYGCLLDLEAGTLTWTLGGVVRGSVAVAKGVAYAPTPGLHALDRYQFNFGQSAFVHSVPAGYRPGVY